MSSQGQKRDGNLKRQRERIVEWACHTFNLAEDELVIITDCASAFGTRKGLQQVCDLMIDGRLSHICFEFTDRLSRTSSEKRLLEHLADRFGVKLVPVRQTINEDEKGFFVKELTDYLTVVANKVNGMKGGEAVRMVVPDAAKERILALYHQGLSQATVVDVLRTEGWKCDKTGKMLSIHSVRETLKEHDNLRSLFSSNDTDDPVLQFISEKCRRGAMEKVFTAPLFLAYRTWAEKNGILINLSKHAFTLHVRRQLALTTGKNGCGYTYLEGLSLTDNARASRSHLA